MKEAPWQIVANAIVSHLPDSIDQRRILLSALVEVIPQKSAAGRAVAEMLFHLNRHSLAQREFPLGDEVVVQHATRGEAGTSRSSRNRGGAR